VGSPEFWGSEKVTEIEIDNLILSIPPKLENYSAIPQKLANIKVVEVGVGQKLCFQFLTELN